LGKEAFAERFKARFSDPEFDTAISHIDALIEIAWTDYCESHKSPRTQKAGSGFADPDYELAVDWLGARERIKAAELVHGERTGPSRILIINGSSGRHQTSSGQKPTTYQ